jgi:hypothetical protein
MRASTTLFENCKACERKHVHKMTPSWGGKELSERIPHGELVNHLIIYSNFKISR